MAARRSKNPKHRLWIKFDEKVQETWERVTDDEDPINWVTVSFSGKTKVVVNKFGPGGLPDVLKVINEDEIFFGGFRVTKVEDQKAKKMKATTSHSHGEVDGSLTITSGDKKALVPRYVGFCITGKNVSGFRKAKVVTQLKGVKDIFKNTVAFVHAHSLSELDEKNVAEILGTQGKNVTYDWTNSMLMGQIGFDMNQKEKTWLIKFMLFPKKSFGLQLLPKAKISDIRKKAEERSNYDLRACKVFFKGKEVKDSDTLTSIRANDLSLLKTNAIRVKVVIPEAQPINVVLDSEASLAEALELAFEKCPEITSGELERPDQLRVMRINAPKTRRNRKVTRKAMPMGPFDETMQKQSLESLGFAHDDTAMIKGPLNITVYRLEGYKVQVSVDEKMTLSELKEAIITASGSHSEFPPLDAAKLKLGKVPTCDVSAAFKMPQLTGDDVSLEALGLEHEDELKELPLEIHMEDDHGNITLVQVAPTMRVSELKAMCGLEDRTLQLHDNVMKDELSLMACRVEDGDHIDLTPWTLIVHTPDDHELHVDVIPDDTIETVKIKLAKEHDVAIDPKKMRLFPSDDAGKPIAGELLNTSALGSISGLGDHFELMVDGPFSINVQLINGKTLSLEVEPAQTVHSMKEQLIQLVGLALGGRGGAVGGSGTRDVSACQFEDDTDAAHVLSADMSLEQAGVEDGAVLHARVVHRTVKAPKPSQVKLAFKGRPLQDGATIEDSGIKADVTVVEMPMAIQVKVPDGRTITLQVSPSDTLLDIKASLEKDHGIVFDDADADSAADSNSVSSFVGEVSSFVGETSEVAY